MSLARLPKVVAVAWLVVALGLTVFVGPFLGWRGWMWLGIHHALCLFGAVWELWVRPEREAAERSAGTTGGLGNPRS